MKIRLPDKKKMVVTDATDPIDYCYHPLYGFVYRARLVNTLRLLDEAKPKFRKLLEIGYGSGQMMPELSKRTAALYGVDIHETIEPVKRMLADEGVTNLVALEKGDVTDLKGYPDASFDAIASVSTLEHVVEIDKAAREIARILEPGGYAVLSFPNRNPVTDLFYRFVGYEPRHLHPSSHEDIMKACDQVLKLEKRLVLWPWVPKPLQLYTSCLYRKV